MGPEGIILVNSPITTFQQSLTHSALGDCIIWLSMFGESRKSFCLWMFWEMASKLLDQILITCLSPHQAGSYHHKEMNKESFSTTTRHPELNLVTRSLPKFSDAYPLVAHW